MTVAAPAFVSPMLVSRGPLPSGPGFAYEVKWDGIRGQVALRDGTVTVRSRPGRDCSESFPELSEPPPRLAGRSAVLDGEIVSLDSDGHPDFAAVRARLTGARTVRRGWLAFTSNSQAPAAALEAEAAPQEDDAAVKASGGSRQVFAPSTIRV